MRATSDTARQVATDQSVDVAASDRRMRHFITDASHELRTPLAAIQGYAELTRQDSSVLPEMTEYSLSRIESEAHRMNSLVTDLLSNARIHTPAGTAVTTAITTGRAADGTAFAELTVTDDGPGIPPEVLPHLFERFVRADKSRSREAGSFGLGLATVASIVEAHHGSIEAESDRARTTFRIRLPLIAQAVSPDADVRTTAPPNSPRQTRRVGSTRWCGSLRLPGWRGHSK
jgi:two-component system sensor histidine kinase TrcS